MKICYFINAYPKISHTFIRREIQAVEAQGQPILRVSLRPDPSSLIDPSDVAEEKLTHYLLAGGWLPLIIAFFQSFARAPVKIFSLLMFATGIGIGSERGLIRHMAYVLEAVQLARICKEQGVRHIHSHFGTNSATVAMFAARLLGGTFSFTAHGADEIDQARQPDMREKLNRAKFVAAVSWFVRSQFMRRMPLATWPKIHVVHCGLGPDYLDAPIPPYPDVPQFVCLGRLCEEKSQHLLVQGAAILRDRGMRFKLVLAGDGPLRSIVEQEIAAKGLQDIVSITGWIDGARVKQELAAARCLILPSLIEGLPVAIMEAMALGRPVISTYVSGIPELVRPGENGWLIPAGDSDAIAEAMAEAINATPKRIITMGMNAKSRVFERHSAVTEAQKLQKLFAET